MAPGYARSCLRMAMTLSLLCVAAPQFAAGADISGGAVSLYWDSSSSSFSLTGPDTQMSADFRAGTRTAWTVGQTADLSASVNVLDATHPRTVTVNGTTYSNVFVKGTLTFRANPFVVPPLPPTATFNRLAAHFTMSGIIEGYSNSSFTTLAFSTSIQGAGVADFLPTRFIPEDGTYCACGGGGTTYTFTGPEPSGWTSADIGAVGLSGNDGITASGAVEVGGAGADIWGSTDAFRFVAQPLAGDGTIVARVIAAQNTNAFAKAGLMLRQSLSATAPHLTIDVKPDHSVELLNRTQSAGATQYLGGSAPVSPQGVWLKLTRVGSQVTAYVSADGSTWTVVGSAAVAGAAYAGLAVTSHDVAALNQAAFDNVALLATDVGNSPLDRSDWTASATESAPEDPAANALDGKLGTRWSTGRAQHDSQGFFVGWPDDRIIGRIRIDVGPSAGDYPRTCGIWVKDRAATVTFVDCQADANGIVDVSFAPIQAKTIEVWQWGSSGYWWSIAEFNVFAR